eukprot:m.8865 g.8865  ORF g.8865 m.8865 type:complete len:477 (+) comp3966_c0_seq1:186-1616(+)
MAKVWQTCIGLEIHAQILSKSKIFSAAEVAFAAAPNSKVSFFDAGTPGTLPLLQSRCVEAGTLTARALNCSINNPSYFDRKHYFYADLPTGYQITQQRVPLGQHGHVLLGFGEATKKINIERLHLEMDSGKSIHSMSSTLIDLNRAGTGLMEIVTAPDLHSGDEAASFVQQLMLILQIVGSCDANMAQGSVRVDANVSIKRESDKELGTRCEIKNISGLRFLSKAIEYEKTRQQNLLENGETLRAETRTYDVPSARTILIRTKEEEVDYRYMPEPDLPPLHIHSELLDTQLPTLPRDEAIALAQQYGISVEGAWMLVTEKGASEYYKEVVGGKTDTKFRHSVLNWIISDIFSLIRANNVTIYETGVTTQHLRELLELITTGTLSGRMGKEILSEVVKTQRSPKDIVKDKNMEQISDSETLKSVCEMVLEQNPNEVKRYKNGENKLLGFFLGQIMKMTKGQANPKEARTVLLQVLKS